MYSNLLLCAQIIQKKQVLDEVLRRFLAHKISVDKAACNLTLKKTGACNREPSLFGRSLHCS